MGKNTIQAVAITGGKGGVGKTNIAVNIGASLANLGRNVYLLDADFGLSNVDVILGLRPKLTLLDVLEGRCQLEDIILQGPCGLNIIPGASGVQKMVHMSARDYQGLICTFNTLAKKLDTFIIDTAPGISDAVVRLALASHEIIVVICDEPASLTDAYAFIKLLNQQHGVNKFRIVVNMSSSASDAEKLFAKLINVTDKYLNVMLHFLGWIPEDELVRKAIKRQAAVVEIYPSCSVTQHFKELAQNVSQLPVAMSTGDVQFFAEQFFNSSLLVQ